MQGQLHQSFVSGHRYSIDVEQNGVGAPSGWRSVLNLCRHEIPDFDHTADPRFAIAIFDDHAAMREALARVLERTPGFRVVATGGSADEAIEFASECVPHVVILDLNMPGGGLHAVRKVARHAPATAIVVLTSEDEAHQIDAVLTAGASAFVVKGTPIYSVQKIIQRACSGKLELSPSLAASLVGSRPLAAPWGGEKDRPIELLEREEQILLRLSQGLTAEEIGESIGLSSGTVEAFVSNIMLKLHAYATAAGDAPPTNSPRA